VLRLWKFNRLALCPAPAYAASRAGGAHGSIRLSVRLACAAIFLAVACMPGERALRAQQGPTDSQVEAAYLHNFLKFVDWPDDPPKESRSPWVLCVVGDTSVGDDLKQQVSGKAVRGHELEARKLPISADLRSCNLLFIGASEKKKLGWILASLRGSSVLTVADMDHFVESGGMIQFVIQDSRVRVAIDVDATSRARLKVSSKLLSLAIDVTGSEERVKN